MKPRSFRFVLPIALAFLVSGPGAASADGPSLFAPGSGQTIYNFDRDVCWFQDGILEGWLISSDQLPQFALESMVANDFQIGYDATITRWIALGGPYCWIQGDLDPSIVNVYFFEDDGGRPGELLLAHYDLAAEKTIVGYGMFGPISRFEDETRFDVDANAVYWFVLQADGHEFPPCWGRLQAADDVGYESMFWGPFWGFDEWTPVHDIGDIGPPPYDAAQAFECESATPVVETRWGGIKALYRVR